MSNTIGLNNLDNQNLGILGSGGLSVPIGSTMQRPAMATPGMIRWNSSITALEYFKSTEWVSVPTPVNLESQFVKINDPSITAPLNANNNRLTNLADPVDAQDAVTLSYLTDLIGGDTQNPAIDATTLNGLPWDYYASAYDVSQVQTLANATAASLAAHIADLANPHQVTKTQLGLDLVDNTTDLNKPISTATQNALNQKLSLSGGTMTGALNMGGQNIINVDNFVGMVCYFAFAANTATVPAGFLIANGAAVSRTTYARLFAKIGTAFGAGNGTTTFNLPDLRGLFIRGLDNNRGIDAGRIFGSNQDDDLKTHSHTTSGGSHTHNAVASTTGKHRHDVLMSSSQSGSGTFSPNGMGPATYSIPNATSENGDHTHAIVVDPATVNITVDATGGAETRPKNVALVACIMY